MGYKKTRLGAGVPNEKVYLLHHYNKHSSKPALCNVWSQKELTAQVNLWTALKEKLQWTFLIEVFLLKCQYYRRLAPRGSGKPYEEILCPASFLPSHLLIQQSVYITCKAQYPAVSLWSYIASFYKSSWMETSFVWKKYWRSHRKHKDKGHLC